MTKKKDIGVVILCRNEGYKLGQCIKDNLLLKFFDNKNIVVIDSSEGNNLIIEDQICKDFNIKFIHRKIGDKDIEGIADLRNLGSYSCPTSWIFHIDVDELFSNKLFENIDNIIKFDSEKIENKTENKIWAYKFPRINLPFYEQYPDYQTRLIHKEKCIWEGNIHEVVKVLEDSYVPSILKEYSIFHQDIGIKSKIDKNIRWNKSKNNILICSLFKDGKKYLNRFLSSLENEIDNIYNKNSSTNQNNSDINQKKSNIEMELCFIEGNSIDNTFNILTEFCKKMKSKYKINYILEKFNLHDSLERFQKLAILRNMLIKIGLRNSHNYILMVDSDLTFNNNLIIKLVESIEKNNADVVAPLIMIEKFRTFGNDYFYDTLATLDNKGKNFDHYFPYIDKDNIKGIKNLINNRPIDMNSVGTCYLIKAELYNLNDFQNFSISKCYREIQDRNKVINKYDGIKKSEQIEFFENLKENNNQIKIILDPSIKALHINLEKIGLMWH
jgi:hypothetical protein